MKSFTLKEFATVAHYSEMVPGPHRPREVDWLWVDGWLGQWWGRRGILAGYSWWRHAVLVPEYLKYAALNDNKMLPTFIHELTHARQRKEMGALKYAVLSCRLWAEFTIEPEAERMEALARIDLHLTDYSDGTKD